ncbi:YnhF family membrane protein [Photobacterium swingsii]|uniref:YnhF family membrane protein n=1 Tax=Photobacterium swingsii TaxID=680026 RepID=A0A2T3PAB8_9GAMM|nr:YnhF family membrane protein [Photobacterium swingsii]PSW25868.1 YnhF family membrane protein [Photobacterium swingsii]
MDTDLKLALFAVVAALGMIMTFSFISVTA